jgi:hypothetical protein
MEQLDHGSASSSWLIAAYALARALIIDICQLKVESGNHLVKGAIKQMKIKE